MQGILVGSLYGLMAMGLSLQYGVCRVLNIAHGEFVMLGAVITYFLLTSIGISPLLAPVIIAPILFALGFVLQSTLFRGLKARAPSQPVFEGSALLIAFGLIYIIDALAQMRWGSQMLPIYQFLPQWLTVKLSFLGIDVYSNQIVAFAIAMVVGVAVYLFLTRSKLGRAIRATAEDPATAGLMGVNTHMTLAFSFGLGSLLAAIAGTLISITSATVTTAMGFNYAVIALIVVTLGGLGSVMGSLIAGILIGITNLLVLGLWKPILTVPVYYAMLMVLLLARPTGLLGKK